MPDAIVNAIDGRAVVRVGGSEMIDPYVGQALKAAGDARDDRDAAELAAATALASSRYFPTRAAGEAGSTTGQLFATDDGAGNLIYYRKTAGGSDEIARAVTPASLASSGGAGMIGFQLDAAGASDVSLEDLLRRGWVIPEMFRQTGAVDETSMMQAMFASGKRRMLIPEGNYTIGEDLILPGGSQIHATATSKFFAATNNLSLFKTTSFTTGTRFAGGYADGNGYSGVAMFDLSDFRAEGAIIEGQSGRNLDIMYHLRLLCWDLSLRDFYSQNCNRVVVFGAGCNAVTIDHPGINTFIDYGIEISAGTSDLPNVGTNIIGGYIQGGPVGVRDQARSSSINGTYFEGCDEADILFDAAIMPIIQRSYHSAPAGQVCVKGRHTQGFNGDNIGLHGDRVLGLFDFDETNTYCRARIARTADQNVQLGNIAGLRVNSSISGTLERGDVGFDVTRNRPYVTTGPDLGSIIQRGIANGYHDIGSGLGPLVNGLRKEDGTFQLVGGGEQFNVTNLAVDQDFTFYLKAVGTPSTPVTVAGITLDMTGVSDGKRKRVVITKVGADGGEFWVDEGPWK